MPAPGTRPGGCPRIDDRCVLRGTPFVLHAGSWCGARTEFSSRPDRSSTRGRPPGPRGGGRDEVCGALGPHRRSSTSHDCVLASCRRCEPRSGRRTTANKSGDGVLYVFTMEDTSSPRSSSSRWANRRRDAVVFRPLLDGRGGGTLRTDQGDLSSCRPDSARRRPDILCTSGPDPLRHAGKSGRPIMTSPLRYPLTHTNRVVTFAHTQAAIYARRFE